jgi:L-ribulose-5-phosphate 3-epimerase
MQTWSGREFLVNRFIFVRSLVMKPTFDISQPNRREFVKQTALAGAAVALPDSRLSSAQKHGPLCIFSKHLHWLDYDETAETAGSLGFQSLDLTVRRGGHVLPENAERDLPRAAAAAQKAGIKIDLITTEIDDAKNLVQQKILKTAAALGIGCYRMAWLKYDEAMTIRKNLQRFRGQLLDLAELNEKLAIRGAYQNHAGANLGSPVWDIAELLEEIHSPWLGCQYDIRHAMVEGANAWPLGLKLVAPYINSIDIKDFQWMKKEGKWQVENRPLGEGMVNFRNYFTLLKKLGVKQDIPICMHYEYDLGGAEKGASKLVVAPEVVTSAMRKDVEYLSSLLAALL